MIWRWPVVVGVVFLAVVLVLALLHLLHFSIAFGIG